MEDKNLDEIFDDEKLNKAIKKGKRKSLIKTVIISLVVLVVGAIGNVFLCMKMSDKANKNNDTWIKLTVPNGYVSRGRYTIGFLGGRVDYKISRRIGEVSVILEERSNSYGIIPDLMITTYTGSGGHKSGEWPKSFWENGYRKMMFFHPKVQYKEYKNDLKELEKLPDEKLIEVALSFDKPYKFHQVVDIIPNSNISWYWVDTFSEDEIKNHKNEVADYDPMASYIRESEILGVSVRHREFYSSSDFKSDYSKFIDELRSINYEELSKKYMNLKNKGMEDSQKVDILGVIVYGTKEELKPLIGNSKIKASSFGVITDTY